MYENMLISDTSVLVPDVAVRLSNRVKVKLTVTVTPRDDLTS